MKCPSCVSTELTVSNRHGIEIDLCPACRGVWLDRGELDKIVERSSRSDDDHDDFDDDRKKHYGHGGYDPRSRRRSWWTELFD